MMKKLTKTIFLIVFVVFIGITKVNAFIDYGRICVYENSSLGTIQIELDQNYVAPIKVYTDYDKYLSKGNIHFSNWSSGNANNHYNGSWFAGDYIADEYNIINDAAIAANYDKVEDIRQLSAYSEHVICPKYVVGDQYTETIFDDALYLYLANDSNLQDCKDAISDQGISNKGSNVFTYIGYIPTEREDAVDDAEEPTSEPVLEVKHATVNYSNFGRVPDDFTVYKCGSSQGFYIHSIPAGLPKVTRLIYNFIMILIPIVLVVLGTLDLVKAIMSQKDDEIRKGRQIFGKRCVTALIIFFVFALVKLIISFVGRDKDTSNSALQCAKCFLSDSSACEIDAENYDPCNGKYDRSSCR